MYDLVVYDLVVVVCCVVVRYGYADSVRKRIKSQGPEVINKLS